MACNNIPQIKDWIKTNYKTAKISLKFNKMNNYNSKQNLILRGVHFWKNNFFIHYIEKLLIWSGQMC